MTVRWVVLVALVAACAVAKRPAGGDDGAGDDGAGAPHDAAPGGGADARTPDASGGGGGGGTGLDPDLSLPDPNGTVCHHPRTFGECASGEVCRYYSPTEGRCETCTSCGHLNEPCSATNQCDTVFECYQGSCVGFCQLGTTECGAIADCVDIGFPGQGVCKPE